ncbi:MAG: hypothetical protein NT007_01190 [Candidatus Kapabacteria bacterium]|nr:hypothetical protein [Candidatus Kapabacteria bacterium]
MKKQPQKTSADEQVEHTEYFTKFLNRFFHTPWFDKPNYLAVFMHLLKNVNWHESSIIYDNRNLTIGIGECVISQLDISKTLKISIGSVNEILKYFERIGEIRKRSTNAFTIISITYLNEKLKVESAVKTERKRSETSIDNKIKKQEENENLIYIVEEEEMNLRIKPELNELKEEISVEADIATIGTKSNGAIQVNKSVEVDIATEGARSNGAVQVNESVEADIATIGTKSN